MIFGKYGFLLSHNKTYKLCCIVREIFCKNLGGKTLEMACILGRGESLGGNWGRESKQVCVFTFIQQNFTKSLYQLLNVFWVSENLGGNWERETLSIEASLGLYFIQQKLKNLLYELRDKKIQHANIWEGKVERESLVLGASLIDLHTTNYVISIV